MAHDHESRLFQPDDLLSQDELAADAEGARSPAVGRDRDLDAAHMWISKDDGLLVRGVKPHSAQKSTLVSRGIDTVSSAMSGKWFPVRHGVQYVELYSGPGRLLDEGTGVEQPGSPMRALSVRTPFTHYVLSDFSEGCVDALSARVGTRSDVDIVRGDANDPDHLDHVSGLLNPRALVVAYLDPARPQDLRWTTVEYLATKFAFIDLIINLPVNSLMRAILGAYRGGGRGAGARGGSSTIWALMSFSCRARIVRTPRRSARSASTTTSSSWPSVSRGRHDARSISRQTIRTTTSCSLPGTTPASPCGTSRTRCRSTRSCRCFRMTRATHQTQPTPLDQLPAISPAIGKPVTAETHGQAFEDTFQSLLRELLEADLAYTLIQPSRQLRGSLFGKVLQVRWQAESVQERVGSSARAHARTHASGRGGRRQALVDRAVTAEIDVWLRPTEALRGL